MADSKSPLLLHPTLRTLTAAEARVHREALAIRCWGKTCDCSVCVEAGVTDRPLRYVPTLIRTRGSDWDTAPEGHTRGGYDEQVWNPFTQRVQLAGHWAHGEELKRWYAAKDRFFASFRDLVEAKGMGSALSRIPDSPYAQGLRALARRRAEHAFRGREPGEEG